MRVGILVGLILIVMAALYFGVFRPAGADSSIPIDSSEAAPSPTEFATPKPPPGGPLSLPPLLPQPKPRPSGPKPEAVSLSPVLPRDPAPAPPAPKPEPPKPKPGIYTVKSGDSLWRIAQKELGDGTRQQEIFELNESTLNGDPDSLQPGQKLILPPK